ncbi:MAG TPA: NAD(P)/FAD-dependent oxidoreductase [Candidatus Eisenbacteria bacterium]|nr:NAD(P)/FAD-dependent oxidoreductase [Candidatus Eisenbacteria bacterium]
MDTCDVVIVGGGPAGSSCAWALRDSGLDVLVLDRATFPRHKLCGGWITPLVLDELEFTPEDYSPGRTLQPITGFRLSAIGGPQVDIRGDRVVSYGIRRCEFDEFLLRRSGARVREGVALTSIERSDGAWLINGEIRSCMLVGAGGHFCPVGRYLGNKGSPAPVLAQEIEFEMDPEQSARSHISGEVPELFFCRDMLGYGWVFRKDNYLNVGLGRTDSHEISRHVKDFVGYLAKTRAVETPASGIAGHAYGLFGRFQRKILDDGVLLIGDAAGLAYPESGEGIRPAIESGLIAAHVIVSAGGNYSTENLSLYRELLNCRLQREHSRLDTLSQMLPHAIKEFAGRQLLRSHAFCRNVVMDQWFLRVAEQRLAFEPVTVRQQLTAI